jgi:lysophospholipase L1-like esterase
MMQPSKTFRKKSGTTPAGMFGAAVVSVLLLCGAGNTPTGNIQTGDVNANGHAITNAANVAATNLNVSTMAALPSNTTVGGTNFGAAAATAAAAGSIDPRAMNLNGCAFVFEGDSITYGYNLSSPTTQCFGCLASQMPFFYNHGTYYNDAVSGATTAAGTSGGQTVTGSWTGLTMTITLTTSPTAPSGPMSVSGTNIPAGTTGTLSGTTLTLSQATTGSGTSVTITLGGNNLTDRYASQVRPHRPAANGGNGGPRAYLFLLIGTNDINNLGDTGAQVISALNTYIAQAQSDGFTVILSPVTPRTSFTAGSTAERYREQVNAAIRLGASMATGTSTVVASNGVLDYASTLSNAGNTVLYGDGLHPTALGHQLIANYINAAMTAGGSQLAPLPTYFQESPTFLQPINSPVGITDASFPVQHFYTGSTDQLDVGYTTVPISNIPANSVFFNAAINSGVPLSFGAYGSNELEILGAQILINNPTPNNTDFLQVNGSALFYGTVKGAAGFQDTTSGHANAIMAFDSAGNFAPINVSTGLTYNISTKTLTASGSGGTVTSITAGTGLSGGTITTSGTIAVQSTTGSTSISSTGTTTLSATGPVNSNALTFGAGSGAYTSSIVLSDSGVFAGQVYEVYCSLPASTNPTINIYDASTGGTLLTTISSNGIAGATTLQFVNSGTAWSLYKKGALLQFQNLADLPSASTARTNLAVPGLTTANNFTAAQTITSTTNPQLTWVNGANTGSLGLDSSGNVILTSTSGTTYLASSATKVFGQSGGWQFVFGTDFVLADNNTANYPMGFQTAGTLSMISTGGMRFSSSSTAYYGGTSDTGLSRPGAGTISIDTTSAGNGLGALVAGAATIGGGTKVKEIKIGTGTLSSGAASLSDAAISSTSAIIVTHLGSSVTNAGALLAYPTGSGTGTVTSANSSDNDTFTYIVVNH